MRLCTHGHLTVQSASLTPPPPITACGRAWTPHRASRDEEASLRLAEAWRAGQGHPVLQTWLAPQGVHHQVLGWCFSSVAPSPLIPPTAAPTPGWHPLSAASLFCSPQKVCKYQTEEAACWAGGIDERG